MEGNANNVVTLKKKGYNTAVLVLLILFVMIIGGIIYYLLCEDEMVIIKNVGDESINSNFNINTIPVTYTYADVLMEKRYCRK